MLDPPLRGPGWIAVGRIPPFTAELEAAITAGEPMPVDSSASGRRRGALPLGRFPG